MNSSLFIVILTIFGCGSVYSDSTEGTIRPIEIGKFGDKIFYEITQYGKLTWLEAKALCTRAELDFGRIDSIDEFSYIYETKKRTDYWIAASQKGVHDYPEQAFEWTDGTDINPGSINFLQRSEQWLCVYLSGDHHSYVDSCFKKHNVLCQKSSK